MDGSPMTPAEIEAIPDPLNRAREAMGFIQRAQDACATVEKTRDLAIVMLHIGGMSQRKIAKELGLSHARIAQITNGKP